MLHLTKSSSATLVKNREIKNTHPVTISNGGSSMGWKSSFSSLLFTSLPVAPPFSWFFFSASTSGCSAGFSAFLTDLSGFFKLFSFPFSFPSLALPSTLSFFFTLNLFLSAMIFFCGGEQDSYSEWYSLSGGDNPGAWTEIDAIVCYTWSHRMWLSGQSRVYRLL